MQLLHIFEYGFMVRAMIAGVIVAVIAPMIGMFLVTRRYSFMADTLAHVALAGVAVGALTGTQPILTALVASLATAIGVELLRSRRNMSGETTLSLFLSGGLAVSSVLLGLGRGSAVNLQSVLFGSIATVTETDVWIIATLGVVVLCVTAVFYRGLFALAHDEELARARGLPVTFLNLLLVSMAAVTVSLCIRIVGVLLVSALMVIPVIAAMQWRRGFSATFVIAVLCSLFSVITGLMLSYQLGLPSGGTIVLTALGVFAVSSLIGRR